MSKQQKSQIKKQKKADLEVENLMLKALEKIRASNDSES